MGSPVENEFNPDPSKPAEEILPSHKCKNCYHPPLHFNNTTYHSDNPGVSESQNKQQIFRTKYGRDSISEKKVSCGGS